MARMNADKKDDEKRFFAAVHIHPPGRIAHSRDDVKLGTQELKRVYLPDLPSSQFVFKEQRLPSASQFGLFPGPIGDRVGSCAT
jgi:hypothetical protein